MPIYDYECAGCGHREERIRKVCNRYRAFACPRCSNEMAHIISLSNVHTWRDLELELETNKPRTFESKKELKGECQRLGKSMPGWDID